MLMQPTIEKLYDETSLAWAEAIRRQLKIRSLAAQLLKSAWPLVGPAMGLAAETRRSTAV
jgi:hypothetical protein